MSTWSGPPLPTGTLTFLFTDVEGSSRPWEDHPQVMRVVMARHDVLLTAVFERHDGVVVRPRGEGDSLFAVFVRASDAVASALDGQRALFAEDWGIVGSLRVRMALLTGEADLREGDYYGSAVNRCARIRSAGYGGQVLLSQTTADLVRASLLPDASLRSLGVHRLRDVSQPEAIFQLEAPGLPASFPPLKTLESRPHNLPPQLTSFLGREQDLIDIAALLETVRLLTLTGPGGTGKTRLALAAAARVVDAFADGVWFVDLSGMSDPAEVVPAIAQVLSVRESEGRSLAVALAAYLRTKRLLLVLDNFEQLLPAAVLLHNLVVEAPHLALLVTSRVSLRVEGEQEYAVPPLPLPDPAADVGLDRLEHNPAVQLFVERARALRSDFSLTAANAAVIGEICRRLDGLPLAIELAAARVKLLPPQALLARLDRRLALLTSGARSLPARQQTLRATIVWSWDLLSVEEQALFRRLGVFTGGWSLEAAEAVCNPDGELEVLAGLASLVDKSLVRQAEMDGEPRFSMLATLQEFALEQLAASGEADAMRRRHLVSCLTLAEEAEQKLTSAAREPWLQRLDAEEDNLRAALGWSIETRDVAVALRLAGALHWYWFFRGQLSEGRRWLQRILALPESGERTVGRAKALAGAWWLAFEQGEGRSSRSQLEESVAIWRASGDTHGLAHALVFLGLAHRSDPDRAVMRACLDESAALFRKRGDRWGLAHALYFLAAGLSKSDIYTQAPDDEAEVRALLEQSQALYRELGDPWGHSGTLWYLGMMAWKRGDAPAAHALLTEALAFARLAQDDWRIASTLGTLADVAAATGDSISAVALYRESLLQVRDLGGKDSTASCLAGLARVAWTQGRPAEATRLLGTVETIIDAMELSAEHRRRRQLARGAAPLRAVLGEDVFAAVWAAGHALSVDAAIEFGLAVAAELRQILADKPRLTTEATPIDR